MLCLLPLAMACGASSSAPPAAEPSSTTTSSAPAVAPASEAKAAPPPAAPEPPAAAETAASTEVEQTPEPCDRDWICLRVPLDGKGKIEKRATRLLGDPKVETTSSHNVDGTRPAKLDTSRPVEIVLRHPPARPGQHVAQLLLKVGAREIPLDKHEGEEFSYVGVIAAEKEGDDAVLLDLRYMK